MKLGAFAAICLSLMMSLVKAQSGYDLDEGDPFDNLLHRSGSELFISANYLPYEKRCWIRRDKSLCRIHRSRVWYNGICEKCHCSRRNHVTCCTTVKKPIDFPADCVPLFDVARCSVVLRLRKDFSVPCLNRIPY